MLLKLDSCSLSFIFAFAVVALPREGEDWLRVRFRRLSAELFELSRMLGGKVTAGCRAREGRGEEREREEKPDVRKRIHWRVEESRIGIWSTADANRPRWPPTDLGPHSVSWAVKLDQDKHLQGGKSIPEESLDETLSPSLLRNGNGSLQSYEK
jgi:hypothetical protein